MFSSFLTLLQGLCLRLALQSLELVTFLCSFSLLLHQPNCSEGREGCLCFSSLSYGKSSFPFLLPLETQKRRVTEACLQASIDELQKPPCPTREERFSTFFFKGRVFPLPLGISGCSLNFKYNYQVYTLSKLCLVPLATALTFIAHPKGTCTFHDNNTSLIRKGRNLNLLE